MMKIVDRFILMRFAEGFRGGVRVQRDDRTTPLQHVLVGQVHQRKAHPLSGAQQARRAAQSAGEGQRAPGQVVHVHAGSDATGPGTEGGTAFGRAAANVGRVAGVDAARASTPSRVSAARGTAVADDQAPEVRQRPEVSGKQRRRWSEEEQRGRVQSRRERRQGGRRLRRREQEQPVRRGRRRDQPS